MADSIPPHPLARVITFRKLWTPRDDLTQAPDSATSDEAAILIQVLDHFSGHSSRGFADVARFGLSFRGKPSVTKLLVARCQRFGWLAGHTTQRVGGVTLDGEAALLRTLRTAELDGDVGSAEVRRRLFAADWEIEAKRLAADARAKRQKEADQRRSVAREAYFDADMLHRERDATARAILLRVARDIGAGRVNDIDAAIETLRAAEAALQAEEMWINPNKLPPP